MSQDSNTDNEVYYCIPMHKDLFDILIPTDSSYTEATKALNSCISVVHRYLEISYMLGVTGSITSPWNVAKELDFLR
jgi:hypothetical protein